MLRTSCNLTVTDSIVQGTSTINNDSLKRKHWQLSSPPPEASVLGPEVQDLHRQKTRGTCSPARDQGIHTEQTLPPSGALSAWSGRGRSPYKTPVTAVLDNIKHNARVLESFERELNLQQSQLQDLITIKRRRLVEIHRDKRQVWETDMAHPLDTAPILRNEKSTSASRPRSTSPVKYLSIMRTADPPITPYYLEKFPDPVPESVSTVLNTLSEGLGEGCIPLRYKGTINAPSEMKKVNSSAFAEMQSRSQKSIEELWKKGRQIFKAAQECEHDNKDENAWSMSVVKRALKWETNGPDQIPTKDGFSRLEFIQTQSIVTSCRQTLQGKPTESKKIDFGVFFNHEHPEIELKYQDLSTDGSQLPALSQLSDAFTQKLILYLGTEVKQYGGNEKEAKAQLFTMLGSGVIRLRQLIRKVIGQDNDSLADYEMPPLLGFTVVGHHWTMYAATGKGARAGGKVYVLEPSCACDTKDYHGVFKLLQLQERIKDWARAKIWPWYCRHVIDPLIKKQALSNAVEHVRDDDDDDDMDD